MSNTRRVTLKEVAAAAAVSIGTVSYALRGAKCIAPETATRVRTVAAELGYRPNSHVSALMAHIRQGRPLARGETIAFIYLEGGREATKRRGFAQIVEIAARRHAAELGYRLDAFWLTEVEGNTRRLAGILSARGIRGVVFGPTVRPDRLELDWPWEEFAVAVVGMSELSRAVPRAGHHHYEAMREALAQVAATGARRPVVILEAVTNQRAGRGWQAAWLACGPKDAARRMWLQSDQDPIQQVSWLKRRAPDAIITDKVAVLRRARETVPTLSSRHCALLAWYPGSGFPGIDQGYDAIAGHAVDLVIMQLQRNERGLPQPPPMLLLPGCWREG